MKNKCHTTSSKKVVFDPTFPEKLCTIDFEEVTKEKVATVTANFLTHPEWDPVSAGMYEFMVFSWIMHPTTLLGALCNRE